MYTSVILAEAGVDIDPTNAAIVVGFCRLASAILTNILMSLVTNKILFVLTSVTGGLGMLAGNNFSLSIF